MKRNLLYCLLFMLPVFMSAQITTGDKLNGNITGNDINDQPVDVQAWLAEGKTVVIDVFATWCGPCWTFHTRGILEDLYEAYGPDGTDQIRVLGLEGDGATTAADLVGTGPNTLGDWTAGVKYPIMDDASFNSLLKIAFFPTLYVIRPDGTVFEAGNFRYNNTFWELALVNDKENDLALFSSLSPKTFCDRTNISETVSFYNMGTTEITSAKLDFIVNGESKEIVEINSSVPIFNSVEVVTPKTLVNETTDFELKVIEINGEAAEASETNQTQFKAHKTLILENTFKIVVTTDFYPGEFSWTLVDDVANVLAEDSYVPGNEDSFGGGGPDANIAHEYEITVDDLAAECLLFRMADSFGDGNTAFRATDPIPGVEIYDANGNLLKEKFATDYLYTSNATIFTTADLLSSSNDVEIVNSFLVSPNPTTDVLNVNVELAVDSKATMSIVNMFGQSVITYNNIVNQVDVSDLPNGNYSIVVRTKEGVASQRFVKL